MHSIATLQAMVKGNCGPQRLTTGLPLLQNKTAAFPESGRLGWLPKVRQFGVSPKLRSISSRQLLAAAPGQAPMQGGLRERGRRLKR